MTTEQKIDQMIRSYRFTVVAFSIVIILLFAMLIYILTIQQPGMLKMVLGDYFSENQFQLIQ